ncbi:hypothetical protein HHK36_014702 [Tetracentron sinense]|uniref:Uncharacterized protein n=1 Tax=Tetracentron sinense TaxID=13715 RepID=A0A835DG20_TETSI|nr:hypothetical protein HHK36_014702 [Tetracentron sinense]
MGSEEEDGLLQNESRGLYTGDGSVDINGNPVLKSSSGNWRACTFILGTECCERLAYCGIAANLVTYLTNKLHDGNVSTAKNITTWQGTCYLAPLIGAVVADAYWGRYWTIAMFSMIYFIGMGTLTLSASVPALKPTSCVGSICPSATPTKYAIFLFGLYLIALGTGGIKPCVSSFGADQLDDTDPTERVLVASFRKWNVEVPHDSSLLYELSDKTSALEGSRNLEHSDELKCLDKAAVVSDLEVKNGNFPNAWRLCTVTQVEELKILIRMFPIWATGIVFSAVNAQMPMFVEQGMVMNTTVGSFTIPLASLLTFDIISVIVGVLIYDRFLVPIARKFTGKERGFSELQRMGIGLFISILSMVAAALVETKRLEVARALHLVDHKVAVPISILWQIPQYFLLGTSEIFTSIGQVEFFYDQSPDAMRSLCSALLLLTTALGSYLSSFILTIVTSITTKGGKPGWISDNLNEGHLDYFFWLLASLSFLNLLVYIFCAAKYKSKMSS